MKQKDKFSDTLLKARKRLGLTQEELAKKLETSRGTVARWELGTRKPRPLMMRIVLEELKKLK